MRSIVSPEKKRNRINGTRSWGYWTWYRVVSVPRRVTSQLAPALALRPLPTESGVLICPYSYCLCFVSLARVTDIVLYLGTFWFMREFLAAGSTRAGHMFLACTSRGTSPIYPGSMAIQSSSTEKCTWDKMHEMLIETTTTSTNNSFPRSPLLIVQKKQRVEIDTLQELQSQPKPPMADSATST